MPSNLGRPSLSRGASWVIKSGYESRYNSKGFLIYRKYSEGLEIWFDDTFGVLYRARFRDGTECWYNEDGTITKVIATNPPNLS